MININSQKMDFSSAKTKMDTILTAKAIDASNIQDALEVLGNLAPIIKIQGDCEALTKMVKKYLDANPAEYAVSIGGHNVLTTGTQPVPKMEWNAELLKQDAKLEVNMKCSAEFEKYFKAPVAAVNATACNAADAQFKQKYGINKTTNNSTITLL